MVKALKNLDKETREALLRFTGILFMSNLRMTLEGLQEDAETLLGGKRKNRSPFEIVTANRKQDAPLSRCVLLCLALLYVGVSRSFSSAGAASGADCSGRVASSVEAG